VRVSDGTSTVDITGATLDLAAMADAVAPRVKKEFERVARLVVKRAGDEWPHRHGASYRGFRVTTTLRPDALVTTISNREPYTARIKWSRYTEAELRQASKTQAQTAYLKSQHGKGAPRDAWIEKKPLTELIRKPARKAEAGLAEVLEADLFALADRGT
jgi:hypothetical protein